MKIEREMPDAGWERAADVALATWKPWLEEHAFTRFVMRPAAAPDGSRVEYLLVVEAWWDTRRQHVSTTLVVDGKVVKAGGAAAAAAYLHRLGFPGKRIDRGLLIEILASYELLGSKWEPLLAPSVHGWADLDDEGSIRRKPVLLEYAGDGAKLSLFQPSSEDDLPGTDAPKLVERLEVRFDRSATLTITHTRERRDGTWIPVPAKP